MITYQEALKIGEEYLKPYLESFDPVIQRDATIEKSYGWIFFYQSRRFVESGDFSFFLSGNAPFLVDKNGDIHKTGSGRFPISYYIEKFDAEFGESPSSP
jgi:hypothetical protein